MRDGDRATIGGVGGGGGRGGWAATPPPLHVTEPSMLDLRKQLAEFRQEMGQWKKQVDSAQEQVRGSWRDRFGFGGIWRIGWIVFGGLVHVRRRLDPFGAAGVFETGMCSFATFVDAGTVAGIAIQQEGRLRQWQGQSVDIEIEMAHTR